jgi:hypothetical protein
VVGVLKGASSQSADYLQLQNSSGNKIAGFDSAGKLQFADGVGGAYDTNLYRDSADVLRTDDTFQSARLVAGSGTVGSSGIVTIRDNVGGTTNVLWIVRDTNNAGAVIRIGGASNQSLTAPAFKTERSGEAQDRFNIQWGGSLVWGDGSAALDTNLYRNAANELKTDDALTVAGNLTANGQQVIIQPSASLTAGQTNIAQTITNASSSGGTVNGYSQTITVSNTGSGSTTNGLNIGLADNASGSPSNIDRGINITITGSNSARAEIGVLSTVRRGVA